MGRNFFLTVLIVLGIAVLIVLFKVAVGRKLPFIQNYEIQEYATDQPFLEPHSILDGLAVYSRGEGEVVLLFPYPHAANNQPMVQSPLADILIGMGRTVVTFDLPGAYRSTRTPVGDIQEIISTADEALERLNIEGPVDVVGHSMGGLSALAYAVERPQRVKKLVLVGGMSGFPAVLQHGMPKSVWRISQIEYWRFITLGLRVKTGWGNLALHKELVNIMTEASFHDQEKYSPLKIDPDDLQKGIPLREILWGKNMYRKLTYAARLDTIRAKTLVMVGKFDTEAPLPCSEELSTGISNSELIIFEGSGHYPYLEEPVKFVNVLKAFLHES